MLIPILRYLAPTIGLGALLIGAVAMAFPHQACRGFGVATEGTGLAYVRATGARDLFIGLSFLYFFWHGDRGALAALCFFTAMVSGADFLITRAHGSKFFSLFHLIATLAIAGYGWWLLKFGEFAL